MLKRFRKSPGEAQNAEALRTQADELESEAKKEKQGTDNDLVGCLIQSGIAIGGIITLWIGYKLWQFFTVVWTELTKLPWPQIWFAVKIGFYSLLTIVLIYLAIKVLKVLYRFGVWANQIRRRVFFSANPRRNQLKLEERKEKRGHIRESKNRMEQRKYDRERRKRRKISIETAAKNNRRKWEKIISPPD